MRQIFFDTETTGLEADKGDRIIEIGCVEMVNRQLTGNNLHLYINPERASHEDALKVHGLTEEFLSQKPKFAELVEEILAFVRGAELIIHNAAFDVGFIDAELRRLRLPPLREHVSSITDSLLMAREQFPGKANSLDALCKRLEVDNTSRTLHGALLDAGLLAEVYIRMTRGQNALVIEEEEETVVVEQDIPAIDLTQFTLPVLRASESECQAHEAIVAELQKTRADLAHW